ncbi:MAG: preprotein translocase subunit SecE [Bacilli bacterium]|nr:preprotein translocase subunit SecE [Bacilli bacterium]
MIFCHGVKSEFKKVFWPTKSDMIKYSITTILFIIFLSLFFYLIDVVFALIQTLFG